MLRTIGVAASLVLVSACWRLGNTNRELHATSVGLPVTVCDSPTQDRNGSNSATLIWSWGDADGAGDTTGMVPGGSTAQQHCRSHTYAAAGEYEGSVAINPADEAHNQRPLGVSVVPQTDQYVLSSNTCTCHRQADLDAGALAEVVRQSQVVLPPGGFALQYQWYFGDGTSASGTTPRVTHTFPRPGAYRVSVTVTQPAHAVAADHTYGESQAWSSVMVSVG